jgi:hypothetical protein
MNKLIKFLVMALVLSGYICIVGINADTHTAASCSQSDVQAAINAASDGDTVELTCTGTFTWNSTVSIPDTKGITLKGPGNNIPKGSADFPLTIISYQDPAIDITCENNRELTRVTGFKFQGGSSRRDSTFISVTGRGRGKLNRGAFRIDNCYFDSISLPEPWPAVIAFDGDAGELTGLVDNCTFHEMHTDTYTIRIRETYTGSGPGSCYGYDSWNRFFTFGDSRFIFIEDCLFENYTTHSRHTVSCDGAGGRYVARYNTFIAEYPDPPDYLDAHGDGTSGLGTGTRGGEIYGNTFEGTDQGVVRNIVIRGGEWLIYDNTFTTLGWASSPLYFSDYRAWSSNCNQVQSPSLCTSGIPRCVTSSDFNTWYPLPGQIQGTYVWNNLHDGVNQAPYVVAQNYVRTYIQENRDYWVSSSKPAALDYYTPYMYPHPLITGEDPPPPDTTPPTNISSVNDGTTGSGGDIDSTSLTTELSANWTASTDSESGISRYKYAIATTAGGTDVVGWTSTSNGTVTSVTRTELTLTVGTKYYFTVKAVNGVGLESSSANSDGQIVIEQSEDKPDVKIYPNPLVISEGVRITFSVSGTTGSEVKIYTISGKLVKKLLMGGGESEVNWDVLNEEGNSIIAGLYIYTITGAKGNRKTGKILIKRKS